MKTQGDKIFVEFASKSIGVTSFLLKRKTGCKGYGCRKGRTLQIVAQNMTLANGDVFNCRLNLFNKKRMSNSSRR